MRQAGRCRWVDRAEPTYLLATTLPMSPSESGWNEVEPDGSGRTLRFSTFCVTDLALFLLNERKDAVREPVVLGPGVREDVDE